jgi:hypothetical protein
MNDLPKHMRKNRAKGGDLAKEYAAAGERGWVRDTPVWGIWHVPEAELHMLPDDLDQFVNCGRVNSEQVADLFYR